MNHFTETQKELIKLGMIPTDFENLYTIKDDTLISIQRINPTMFRFSTNSYKDGKFNAFSTLLNETEVIQYIKD